MRCVFGIDVSKASMNIAIVVNKILVKEDKLSLNSKGFKSLNQLVKTFNNPEIVFEATGVYSRRLQFFLDHQKLNYVCMNPLKAKKQLDNLRPNKTDRNDARRLAETQFLLNRLFTYKMNPIYHELMDLSRFYQEIVRDCVVNKNRLHRALQLTFPEIESLMYQPKGSFYWKLVNQFSDPRTVLKMNGSSIEQIIIEKAPDNTSAERTADLTDKLQELAKSAYPSVSSQSSLYYQINYLTHQLIVLDNQKALIIEKMVELAESLPEYNCLLSIPGFGKTTVVSLIGELGDIRRFKSSNALNAYIGIDLRHYESGSYVATDHISKRGNPIARKVLFKAIQNIATVAHYYPNHINDFYQKKKQQSSGRGTKKVAIATMHRLIRTIYHLVKYNQVYDYGTAKS